jgi:hypothetical protein
VARRFLCLLLIALVCASCDVQKMLTGITPEQDLARAHHAFDLLRTRDFAALEGEFAPAWRHGELRSKLADLADKIPDGPPVHDSVTYVKIENTNGHRTVMLILLYQFPDRWLQFEIFTHGDSLDAMAIDTLDVSRVPIPPTPALGMGGLTTPIVLVGLVLWLVLMLVIYRRYRRKAR